jgi:iron complex outermembrane receptor protein
VTVSNVNDDFDSSDPASLQAANDRSKLDQDGFGLSAQLSFGSRVVDRPNQLTLGVSADSGEAVFIQDSQDAELTEDRSAVGITAFEQETHAQTRNRYYGVYAANALELSPRWAFSTSGRYDIAQIAIEDRSGLAPELNGEHSYSRFNPALGINFKPSDRLTAYAGYNQGSRAPTPIELTCADPEAPCKLPNNFVADPPLDMVVSRTVEAGMRGVYRDTAAWGLAVYRTRLQGDLHFISAGAGATNAGYFTNVGQTQRKGFELNGDASWRGIAVSASYAFLDATYETSFVVNSPSNSAADSEGNIVVRPGDSMPGLPRHSGRLRAEFAPSENAQFGVTANFSSSVYARGDESNQDVNGLVPGWVTVNLDGRVALSRRVELAVTVVNIFDRKYANFGTLGANWFSGPGQPFEQFRGPGAPRGAWLGIRYARN